MHYREMTYEVTLISSDHYKNNSIIVDLAMGQIPRSTECISSSHYYHHAAAIHGFGAFRHEHVSRQLGDC